MVTQKVKYCNKCSIWGYLLRDVESIYAILRTNSYSGVAKICSSFTTQKIIWDVQTEQIWRKKELLKNVDRDVTAMFIE